MKRQPETNRLLEAVNKLTRPHKSRVIQSNAAGITCTSVVEHDPLLIQLRDAVAGGTGRHAGGSLGSERIPLDPGALELFDRIAGQVNVWYLCLPNVREDRYIDGRLTDWYVDFENRRRGGDVSESVERVTIRLVEGWAASVEGMFDPPDQLGIKSVCPNCGARYAIDPRNGDRIAALLIEYQNLGPYAWDESMGICRSCGVTWPGLAGVRNLRSLVDGAEPGPDTVEGFTADQLKVGLKAALLEFNMKAARSLNGMLALVDPVTAELVRDMVQRTQDDRPVVAIVRWRAFWATLNEVVEESA